MAELDFAYVENATTDVAGASVWSTVALLPAADLTASTKYLLLVKALQGGANVNSSNYRMLTTDSEGDDIGVSAAPFNLWQELEPSNVASDDFQTYMFVRPYTTPATPTDIVVQHYGTDESQADQVVIVPLNLDDLGSGNYVEAYGNTAGAYGAGEGSATTTVQLAALAADEKWLLLGYVLTLVGSTNNSYGCKLVSDPNYGGSLITADYQWREGEDTTEQFSMGHMGVHYSSSGALQPYLAAWNEFSNNHTHIESYLIAIKTSVFADFEYVWSATGDSAISGTPASPTTLETITGYTPTVDGNHLVLGRYNYTTAGATARIAASVLVDGTEALPGDLAAYQTMENDPTDAEQATTVAIQSISGTVDITLKAAVAGATPDTEYHFLAVLNLNLASSAQVIAVGTATELETAQPVAALKPITTPVGQTSETELARPVAALKPIVGLIGQTSEIEVARPVVPLKPIIEPVGLASETETAVTIAAVKQIITAVGFGSEAETAQPVGASKQAAIGQAVESELTQIISPLKPILQAVGTVTESELTQVVSSITEQIVAVGQATETEVAQTIIASKPIATAVGTTSEAELTQVIAAVKPITVVVVPASEVEVAQPVLAQKIAAIGLASETESPQPVVAVKPITALVGPASEAEVAQTITPVGVDIIAVGTVTESEVAQAITAVKPIIGLVGTATEVELTQAVGVLKPIFVVIGTATESESAIVITKVQGLVVYTFINTRSRISEMHSTSKSRRTSRSRRHL